MTKKELEEELEKNIREFTDIRKKLLLTTRENVMMLACNVYADKNDKISVNDLSKIFDELIEELMCYDNVRK